MQGFFLIIFVMLFCVLSRFLISSEVLSHFFSRLTCEVTKGHYQAQIYRLGEREAHGEGAIYSRSNCKEVSGPDSQRFLRCFPPAPGRHHTQFQNSF